MAEDREYYWFFVKSEDRYETFSSTMRVKDVNLIGEKYYFTDDMIKDLLSGKTLVEHGDAKQYNPTQHYVLIKSLDDSYCEVSWEENNAIDVEGYPGYYGYPCDEDD